MLIKRGIYILCGSAIFILLAASLNGPFPFNKVFAARQITLDEAVAFAREQDDSYLELEEDSQNKKKAWLRAAELERDEAEPSEEDISLSEVLAGEMGYTAAALDYLKSVELLRAREQRLAYEVEQIYIKAMLARQQLLAAEERLATRQLRLSEARLSFSYGIIGEQEIGAVEDAWKGAREEVMELRDAYNDVMEKMGVMIGIPLDDSWFVEDELLYRFVHEDEFGEIMQKAFANDSKVNISAIQTRSACITKELIYSYFALHAAGHELAILEAACRLEKNEAELEGIWQSWLWLLERDGVDTSLFDNFDYSLLAASLDLRERTGKGTEERLDVYFRVRESFKSALTVSDIFLEANKDLSSARERYELESVKHRFGLIGYGQLVRQEDVFDEAKRTYLETVFEGQEILSDFNYKVNGFLRPLNIEYTGELLPAELSSFLTPCPRDCYLSISGKNELWAALDILQAGYHAAVAEEELELGAGLQQLHEVVEGKLCLLTIKSLAYSQDEAATEKLKECTSLLLQKKTYSDEELLELDETGKMMTGMFRSLQVLPLDRVVTLHRHLKMDVPPVFYRGRIYVSPDYLARLLEGNYINQPFVIGTVESLITWEGGLNPLYFNGEAGGRESIPLQVGEYTLLPLRLIVERFGFKVHWHQESGLVLIAGRE